MICLIEILKSQGIELGRYKIHLATTGREGSSPLDAFLQDTFKEWQEEQNANNFQCDTVISLIFFGIDQWLFAGVYRILGVEKVENRFMYKTDLYPSQNDLVGRIIVRFKRDFRQSYLLGENYGHQLEVAKILELPFTFEDFKGYKNFLLTHKDLQLIVNRCKESWRAALSSVGGVYLIVDTNTGKMYVGSAYGEGGIWSRWNNYAGEGHGNNTELVELLEREGREYAEHFQYAILEIADRQDTKEQVIERETHWKNLLMSRDFGYNAN